TEAAQLRSALFLVLTRLLGHEYINTTVYQPAANEIVERPLRQLNALLMAQLMRSWTGCLPLTVLNIRSVLKEYIQSSTAELFYGSTPRLPGDLFNQKVETSGGMLNYFRRT
ncbi:hypothetical protein AHF37_02772, partial [Paragonimus kellicotti]